MNGDSAFVGDLAPSILEHHTRKVYLRNTHRWMAVKTHNESVKQQLYMIFHVPGGL